MTREQTLTGKDASRLKDARFFTAILLGLVLLVGGALRFNGLESRQPRISDEADYIMEARWISSLAHATLESLAVYRMERRSGKDIFKKGEQIQKIAGSVQGHAPYLARPGHVLLIALTMQFGMDPVLAGVWESAFFGLLTVFLLFFFARRFYGTRTGLVAALLLAVSAYHVWYSRTGFSEADTTFFLLLTLYLYVLGMEKDRSRYYLFTGLSAGIGFLIHHRFALFLSMICLLEVFRFFRMRSSGAAKRWVWQFLTLLICFSIPALVIELLYHVAFIAFQAMGKPLPCATYFSQLLVIFGYIRFNNLLPYAHFFAWSNFLTFPYLFWYMEGPLFCGLLAGGILTLAVRRKRAEGILALFFLAPLLFYSYKNANARFACSTLPFAVLAIALFLEALVIRTQQQGRSSRNLAFIALGAVLIAQAWISLNKVREHDGLEADWKSVMAYLQRSGNVKNISVYPHMSKLYLGEAASAIPPDSVQGLKTLYEEGFTSFILVEFLDYYAERFNYPGIRDRLPSVRALIDSRRVSRGIHQQLEPVFTAPCDFCSSPLNILEINLNFRKSLAFMNKGEENNYKTIKVYDLKDFFLPEGKEGP